jgi:hypothetical protein
MLNELVMPKMWIKKETNEYANEDNYGEQCKKEQNLQWNCTQKRTMKKKQNK